MLNYTKPLQLSSRALFVLTSFPISILSFSYILFFKTKSTGFFTPVPLCFHERYFIIGFFNPQYGPLLCLLQLVCTNWSSNVLRLSSYLYVFKVSKLTRIQMLEEQRPCFLRLTSALQCL